MLLILISIFILLAFAGGYFLYRSRRPYYLYLEIESFPEEVPSVSPLYSLFSRKKPWTFSRFIYALNNLKGDRAFRGIFIDLSRYRLNLSQTYELRETLRRLKEGRKIICYSTWYSEPAYYLATICDEIYMAPSGYIEIPGLVMQNMYFRELFDTLNIIPQFVHKEEYKSAVEPFTRREPSKYDLEQRKRLMDIYYENLVKALRERGIDEPDSLINNYAILYGKETERAGLTDGLVYKDSVEDILKEKFRGARRVKGVKIRRGSLFARNRVVVVVANGPIVDADTYNPLEESTTIGTGLAEVLRKLHKDKSVKAVVLRVNSPGGSALTSDIIAHEVRKLARDKLVVVSMGLVAASGGYYISTYANRIFLNPFTITGSIGVLYGKLAMEDFFRNKLHINPFVMNKGDMADALTMKPLDEKELKRLDEFIDEIYGDFLRVVSEGRNMPVDSVREVAKGRIWVGKDAIRVGIADTIGTVADAIEFARSRVGRSRVVFLKRRYRTRMDLMSLLAFSKESVWMVDFRLLLLR